MKVNPEYVLDSLQEEEAIQDIMKEIVENTKKESAESDTKINMPQIGMASSSLKETVKSIVNKSQLGALESVGSDQIRIKNEYKSSHRKGYYDWEVYLDVNDKVAQQIDSVTYTLHPTFLNNVIKVDDDPTGRYLLHRSGWGEFEIRADVRLKNSSTITKYHWLNLGSQGIVYPK